MVLFQKYIRRFGPSTKMAPTAELSLLSSAVAAILVGGLKCRTQFWKGTTQGSFQQSLVEIGSNLLLRNHWANCNQTLVVWSLDGPLPKLCPMIPTSNQDGHQAKTNDYFINI
jgi:hypothetical protein